MSLRNANSITFAAPISRPDFRNTHGPTNVYNPNKPSTMTNKLTLVPRKYWGVAAVLLAIIMSVLDVTIANVALPTFTDEFDVTPSSAIWIVNSYQLVVTISLLSFASLGDLYGYRRVFLTGIALFVAASVLCACSQSFPMLVAARLLQGFGGAGIMSVNTALLRLIYPPEHLGRGLGLNAMVVAVSTAAGPSVAGTILTFASWHWLFLINIPIGLTAFLIGRKLLPRNPQKSVGRSFDKISCLGNALTFGLLIYSLEGFAHDERRELILLQLAVMALVGYFFIRRQCRMEAPLLPVDLLHIPIFALSMGTSITSFTAQTLAMVSLPFFLQDVLCYNVGEIGLLLTPWPLATILAAPLAGRLVERFHPGLLGGVGMLVFACGLFALYVLPPHPEGWNIAWRMALCGLGFGLFQTPNNFTIISSAPARRSGGASGMLGTARLFGQTVGTTLVALILRLFVHDEGVVFCLLLATVFALTAGVVSCLRLSQPAPNRRR